jgi:hypothetical protein
MKNINRGSLIAGVGLILLGALFIVFNLLPDFGIKQTWPMILIVAGFGFCLPALAWPDSRKGLAALFIPGSILFVLGAVFLFNTLTPKTWGIWAFAWILIPASVGLGMMLAAKVGEWSHGVWVVGTWMAILSVALFAIFAAIFGENLIQYIGAGILVLMGLYLLVNSFLKKAPTA